MLFLSGVGITVFVNITAQADTNFMNKTMKPEEIKAKLDAHAKWLRNEDGEFADFRRENLSGADLSAANLSVANLSRTTLSGTNLSGTNLSGANLSEADLSEADLSGANLSGAKNIPALIAARLMACPSVGAYTAFKKCQEGVVELLIPADALRSSATTRKCRASKALVVKLPDGCTEAHSGYDVLFCYRVGETVTADKWEPDRWIECGGGIHHFITREEAEAYQI